MKRPIVRLSSLQLTNIKNVKNGTIYMPNTVNKILSADKQKYWGFTDKMVQEKQRSWMPYIFYKK